MICMKKNWNLVFKCVLLGLIIVCIYKIAGVENKVEDLVMNMNSRLSQVSRDIDSVNSSVSQTLEAQASLISDSAWQYTDVDIDKREVTVHCSVSPKTYNPGITETYIVCNGVEYPMQLEKNAYTTDIVLPLFSHSDISGVLFKENGTVSSQKLQWYFDPRYDCIPIITADFSGSRQGQFVDDVYRVMNRGMVNININNNTAENKIKEVNLIYRENGVEIKREAVDISYEGQTRYINAMSGNTTVTISESQDFENGRYSYLNYYLNDTIDISYGNTYEIYVEVIDSYDLHYEALCYVCGVDENKNEIMSSPEEGREAVIKDGAGNVIYEAPY